MEVKPTIESLLNQPFTRRDALEYWIFPHERKGNGKQDKGKKTFEEILIEEMQDESR